MHGELTPEQIENVLRSELTGRLGCHAEGRTYVVPISYAYDGVHVYGHSSDGLKIRMMRANAAVCFEVEQIDDLANWRSVIAWGVYEELAGPDEHRARRRLKDRFGPYVTSETAQPSGPRTAEETFDPASRRAIFYRIRLTEKTGRYEKRS